MSLFKKAIVTISAIALAAPTIATGISGVAAAAVNPANVKTESVAKPNTSLKVPLRDANNIFNLKLEKQKDGYVLVSNIAVSGNNVIQKGDKFTVKFSNDNVDLNNSSVVNQEGSLPFTTSKDAKNGTVTYTFNKDVDSGNYETAIGVATKNLNATTPVTADLDGAPISIANNKITSNQRTETTRQSTSQSTYTQSQANASQGARTQAASTGATSYTTSYTTTQQAGTTTTTQQSDNSYTPTFDEAKQAIMNRTTITVTGDATANTETSANQATTNNGFTASTTTAAQPATSTTAATTTTAAANQATTATATQADTTGTSATQAATTGNSVSTTATVEPTAESVQATANATNVIKTPNGVASDLEATLQKVLQNQDTDPNSKVDGDNTTYQSNETFESIRTDVSNKMPTATAEEKAEMVKVLPWIWNNAANAASQDQVFNYSTLLSTGRTAYTTINGSAISGSSNIFSQNMPALLKAFGENMTAGAFDNAMDIDTLLESQVYQDYLAKQHSATTTADKLDASTAWANMNDHITITKVDSNTNTAGATKLDPRYYSAKATLDDQVAAALAKQNSERADKLVINKVSSGNEATDATTEAASTATTVDNDKNSGSALFNQIQTDINNKMTDATTDARAQVLGALPGILNDLSKNTASGDNTGTVAKYLQPTTDGSSYLITLDTTPVLGSANKYLANLPQVFKSFGDSLKDGSFDQAVSTNLMLGSSIYQDYLDGKYTPDSLITTTPGKTDTSDLFSAIILAILAFPLVALAMGTIAIVTSPLWVPLASIVWGVVLAITALPIGLIAVIEGLFILPSLILFPIMLVVSLFAAPILLVLNLIPIINLITVPISLVLLALTFIPGAIVLGFIPFVVIAALVVIAGLAVAFIMIIGLVIAQIIAGILSIITGGLLAMLLPITALIGLIIAGLFSLLGLFGFALIAGLILGFTLGLIILGAGILTVVAGGFAGLIGLGLLAGLGVVILGYLAFLGGGLIAGLVTFLILLLLMPQFLVLNFLLWFIGFGFMALILTDLAIPSLYLAIFIGFLMMLFFVPGLLIALSWPFWAGLVLAISIPIVEIALIIGAFFAWIPLFGWIADIAVGIVVLAQAIALAVAVVAPIVIGVFMMTIGIIGFDIMLAAAAVLELIKKKQKKEVANVTIDPSWVLQILPVGFWTKKDPLDNIVTA